MENQPIILHIWPGFDSLPSSSPFCIKVIEALKYKHLPVKLEAARSGPPKWARRDRLPVAEIGFERFEDSTRILKAVDRIFPETPRLYPENAELRADTVVLEEWADEFLALYVPNYRWTKAHHWATFSKKVFGKLPFPARKLVVPRIRKHFIDELMSRGIAADTEEERIDLFKEAMGILGQRLARSTFLVTGFPTAADFSVYGVLKSLKASEISELVPLFETSEKIMGWMGTMDNLEAFLNPAQSKSKSKAKAKPGLRTKGKAQAEAQSPKYSDGEPRLG